MFVDRLPLICFEADGVGGGDAAPAAEVAETVAESSPAPENGDIITCETEEGSSISLVTDPVTGETSIKLGDSEEEAPEESEAHQEAPVEAGDEGMEDVTEEGNDVFDAAPEKYTLDEFSEAIATGNVDGDRVPKEYQTQYADFKIKQAMNKYVEKQRQEREKRETVQRQLSPAEQIQANRDFFRQLNNDARIAALADLGITQEKLDESEFEEGGDELREDFQTAFNIHRQRLINDMERNEENKVAAKRNQQAIYDDIRVYIEGEKAKDPKNFAIIDKWAIKRLDDMPSKKARPIEAAFAALRNGTINPQQVKVLQAHWEDSRKEFFAKKNGLSTKPKTAKKPPVVENAGSGKGVSSSYRPDYNALGKAKGEAKVAWLKDFFDHLEQ